MDSTETRQDRQILAAMRVGAVIVALLLLCAAPLVFDLYPHLWAMPFIMVVGAINLALFAIRGR